MKIFAIYDSVANTYISGPILYNSLKEAVRDFSAFAPSLDDIQRARYADCFLYELGSFDSNSFDSPILLTSHPVHCFRFSDLLGGVKDESGN